MSIKDDVVTFLKAFNKPPQMKILNSLAEKPDQEFTKTDMASRSGIGRTTLYRVWDDLERMRAITASRKVGAITLYRLNLESHVVQSILSIRDRLQEIDAAVSKIEDLRNMTQQGKTESNLDVPPTQAFLLQLLDLKATTPTRAILCSTEEAERIGQQSLQAMIQSGLIQEVDGRYSLTSLGVLTAEGAAEIWRKEGRHTIGELISSLKVALDTVSGDIKQLSREITG